MPTKEVTTKWKPGQSGNPAGRPKGKKNRSTEIKTALEAKVLGKLNKDVEDVYNKVLELALEGDTTCLKMLLDRMAPVQRIVEDRDIAGSKGITINIAGMSVGPAEEHENEPIDVVAEQSRD